MVCPACTDRAACRKAKDCAADPQRIVAGARFPNDVVAAVHVRHVAMVEAVVSSDRGAEMRRPHMVGTL